MTRSRIGELPNPPISGSGLERLTIGIPADAKYNAELMAALGETTLTMLIRHGLGILEDFAKHSKNNSVRLRFDGDELDTVFVFPFNLEAFAKYKDANTDK